MHYNGDATHRYGDNGMNVVLLGPPGSGKSTVAQPLVNHYNVLLIATGQRLREEIATGSSIGHEVESYLDRGEYAPDALMERLIRQEIAQVAAGQGFLMDGYPRTEHQALTLEAALRDRERPLTAVINLEVADDEVVRRMSGRRICEIEGEEPMPVHIDDEEAIARCQERGGTLTQRDDDTPELLRQRLATYHARTTPLIAFYRTRGLLLPIDGRGPADQVVARVFAQLAQR